MKKKREKNTIFMKTANAIPALNDASPSVTRTAIGVAYVLLYTFQDFIKPMQNLERVGTVIIALILLAIPMVLFFPRLKRDGKIFISNLGKYVKYVLPRFVLFLIIYLILGMVAGIMSGNSVSVNEKELDSMPFVAVALLAMFYAPFIEETVYRGLVRWVIRKDAVYVIVSALLFGFIHVMDAGNDIGQWMFILQYGFLGGANAYLYVKSNNIFAPMLNHFLLNGIATVVGLVMM